MMTHAGTRLFCRSSFASRFFCAFDFLPMMNASSTPGHLSLSFRPTTASDDAGLIGVAAVPDT